METTTKITGQSKIENDMTQGVTVHADNSEKITEELHFILRFRVFQHRIKTSECCMIKYMHICAYNVNYHTNRNGMFVFIIHPL